MEGTCVGRVDQTFPTEDDLLPRFVDIFKKTPGMPLVWCSGQNLDRIVTILTGNESIRDCIAFPKTQKGTCLMTEAPSEVDEKQLKELGIVTIKK